jgi:hypothetical protein
MEKPRPIWRHEAVAAWLLIWLVAWYVLRSHSDLHWVIMTGSAVLALAAVWRWSRWRKRFKWLWTAFVLLVWVMDFFTARPVPADESAESARVAFRGELPHSIDAPRRAQHTRS